MVQVGKVFNKIPYIIRDKFNQYNNINFVENLTEKICEKGLKQSDIINIFSNNRDNLYHFHLLLKNNELNKEYLIIDFENTTVEITLEQHKELKNKSPYINSLVFIEIFKNLNECDLSQAFDCLVGCNGKNLFISYDKDTLKMFLPNSNHYKYRKILLKKIEIIKDVASSFEIDYKTLIEDLNPNIVKSVCKDLNITYKFLANELGYKPDTLNKAASTGKISEQLSKAIDLYLENLSLKEELKSFKLIKESLKNC